MRFGLRQRVVGNRTDLVGISHDIGRDHPDQ
jgi:hypothetical protein